MPVVPSGLPHPTAPERPLAQALRRDRWRVVAGYLVQTCLERALGSVADKRPEGDLRAWLFTILYRQFVEAGDHV